MHKFFEQIPEAIYFFTDEKLCPFFVRRQVYVEQHKGI